jgi:small subunit ribosomal protein S3
LRADIDYADAEAFTPYGVCGVKVWIFKGEILNRDPLALDNSENGDGESVKRRNRG